MSFPLNDRLLHHPQPQPGTCRGTQHLMVGCVNTTTNARFATEVEWKVVLKSWSSTCDNLHGFGRYMDGEMNKAEVISGLFGLITATLEDAHVASVVGQGSNRPDDERQAAINNLWTAQGEIAILLSAIELIGCSASA